MNTPHTHVWCNLCQMIRPLLLQDMHADDASGAYSEASDLRCGACGFVIATLYCPSPRRGRSRRYGEKHEDERAGMARPGHGAV